MKKAISLLIAIIFCSFGCVGQNEILIKKDDLNAVQKSVRGLIREEEAMLIKKKDWNIKDIAKYSMVTNRNNQILAVFGAWQELKGKKLKEYIKAYRSVDILEKHIAEQIKKAKEKAKRENKPK